MGNLLNPYLVDSPVKKLIDTLVGFGMFNGLGEICEYKAVEVTRMEKNSDQCSTSEFLSIRVIHFFALL